MKKLFLLTLTLFLFGCDPVEQDTRLLCDCYRQTHDRMDGVCDDRSKNKSLIFNESNEKFIFDDFAKGQMVFRKDRIERISQSDKLYFHFKFDRTNLVYSERYLKTGDFETTNYYQCRLTDGV